MSTRESLEILMIIAKCVIVKRLQLHKLLYLCSVKLPQVKHNEYVRRRRNRAHSRGNARRGNARPLRIHQRTDDNRWRRCRRVRGCITRDLTTSGARASAHQRRRFSSRRERLAARWMLREGEAASCRVAVPSSVLHEAARSSRSSRSCCAANSTSIDGPRCARTR